MASKPLEQVTLADLATKDDLKDLVTRDHLHQELNLVRQEFREEIGSAVNMVMGEIGKINARLEVLGGLPAKVEALSGLPAKVEALSALPAKVEALSGLPAQQEETNRILARLLAKSEGVAR